VYVDITVVLAVYTVCMLMLLYAGCIYSLYVDVTVVLAVYTVCNKYGLYYIAVYMLHRGYVEYIYVTYVTLDV